MIEDAVLSAKLAEWLSWDKNRETKEEMESLKTMKDIEELGRRLLQRMKFGTAGLRAPMGAGYSRMNDLTIIQTTQGFCEFILSSSPDAQVKGVIIGYDGRHHSKRFAELAATVLMSRDVKVFLFSGVVPTPFVAYGVTLMKCAWGIMVTASHNPKEDNGYKVYGRNGAQIQSPRDSEIEARILENLTPWPQSWEVAQLKDHPLVRDPMREVLSGYMGSISRLCANRELNEVTPLKFTYTAMHGVGYRFFREAFIDVFKFKDLIPCKEQIDPNPDFPTVKFPNPEEGKSALNLAFQTAEMAGSTIILANDPDADRLAVAEKSASEAWHVFTGNELGALLGWWMIEMYRRKGEKLDEAWCSASAVSSQILRSICKVEGVNYKETLTGFKYMGNFASDVTIDKKCFIFAFEEAIGFMCSPTVLDKDGISAGCVLAEMAVMLNKEGRTMHDQLEKIYEKYGYHYSINSYYVINDPLKIKKIFDRIRKLGEKGGYPTKVGEYNIKHVRDLHAGYDNEQPDNKPILPVSTSSEMMTFTFAKPPAVITLRTSGTEPKIKYYSEYISPAGGKVDQNTVKKDLENLVRTVVNEFLQPVVNSLRPKEDSFMRLPPK